MKIKVCGLKDPDNIKAVAALSPDYMGFICYDQTPRFIGDLPADVLSDVIPLKTGVFVNAPFDQLVETIHHYDFDAVQLHGDENPGICAALKHKRTLVIKQVSFVLKGSRAVKKDDSALQKSVTLNKDVQVIKAFGVDENFDFDRLNAYADSVDYFLFDAKTPKHGGSGNTFDWDILQQYKLNVPFFLSGGLNMDNLGEVKEIKHPAFYGVDLNSRFETEPGIKNIELLQKAFNLLIQPVTQ